MTERKYCNQPDRHVPTIKCGYPLPCPWHTVIIEGSTIAIPENKEIDEKTSKRLKDITDVLQYL